jgi:uncharacterized protein (DUF58 family)
MNNAYCTLTDLLTLRLKAKKLKLCSRVNTSSQFSGGKKSLFKGRGIDFEEVRPYAFGDDVRSIDWRVTARKMKPHTKIFQEEREKPHIIILDQSLSMLFGSSNYLKSVAACHCAAVLAWAVLKNGDRIGGVIFNNDNLIEIKPKRSQKSIVNLLNHAAEMSKSLLTTQITEDANTHYMNKALRHARRVAKSGNQLFIISDFYSIDDEMEASISKLSKHNQLMLILVYDVLEQQLPKPALYSISNGEQLSQVNTANKKLKHAFTKIYEQRQQRITNLAEKYGIAIISIDSGSCAAEQLLNTINYNKL